MNQNFTLLLVLCCIPVSGCAHTQLRWNTTHQAKTLTEIYEQQVLDNLAMFVHDAGSLPSFAFPNAGGTDVTDGASFGNDMKWVRPTNALKNFLFTENLAKFGSSRSMKEAWTLTPVYDVRRLELMRCAYQDAVACSGLRSTNMDCPDCDKIRRAFYLGQPSDRYDDSDEKNNLSAWTEKTGRTTPACFTSVRWLCCGKKKDLPKDKCTKIGHYCGTYVWLNKGGQNELTKLTMVILDYAYSTQPGPRQKSTKDITIYMDEQGNLISKDLPVAIEIKSTVPFDKPADMETLRSLKRGFTTQITGWKDLTPQTKQDLLKGIYESDRNFNLDAFNLNDQQKSDVRNARERLRSEMTVPDDVQLPRIQSPSNGFSPLQFELYRQTLTQPTP
jgi:hypothetical protein